MAIPIEQAVKAFLESCEELDLDPWPVLLRSQPRYERAAWCRYVTAHERPTRIVLCDSDSKGAFEVFRRLPPADPWTAPLPRTLVQR